MLRSSDCDAVAPDTTDDHLLAEMGQCLTTVDFESGETVCRQPTGTGIRYSDFGAPLTLSASGAAVFIGTLGGLLRIRDRRWWGRWRRSA